jgi:lipoic acid synthetase/lipoate-protein ligase A
MIYISLPDNTKRNLSFYLSMEEYVAKHKEGDDYFFMWQVEPSVIFGRNQLIENEVNLSFCREHNIKTYRRKSGGGCVYADMSNVMFSYITKDENVNFTFNRYINMVVLVLRKLGVEAKANGRNDIMIENRKVSGNAFYHIPGRSIVHGTMLYDTNMINMVGSITPTDEKLLSKGVNSVRQRIALLKDYTSISLDEFKDFVRTNLCEKEIMLSEDDILEIKEIEKEYLSNKFIYGNNPRFTVIHKRRVEGVGDFEVRIELKNEVIKEINIMGDFFIVGDIDKEILTRLRNVKMEREAIMKALPERVDNIIHHLNKETLTDIIINK